MRASFFTFLVGVLSLVAAIDLNLDSTQSVLNASKTMVQHIMDIFPTEGTPPHTSSPNSPGLLPKRYYFWNSGLAHSVLLNYWAASGDNSIAPFIRTGLLFQVDEVGAAYMSRTQIGDLANEDQAFWALAAMTAAELNFPISEDANNKTLSWLGLAQTVYEMQAQRWNASSCGGGLKWRIFNFQSLYNRKNSISNGLFAELAARLYRFTGNETYANWAQKSVEWSRSVGLIGTKFDVYEGTDDDHNCTSIDGTPWSRNAGVYLKAASYMSNATKPGSPTNKYWNDFTKGIFYAAARTFIDDDTHVIYEEYCEESARCSLDAQSSKSVLVRGFADSSQLLTGESFEAVRASTSTILHASAKAAAMSCEGECGYSWRVKGNDGLNGVGSYLNALEVFLAHLPARPIYRANNAVADVISISNTTGSTATAESSPTPGKSDPANESGSASHLLAPLASALAVVLTMVLFQAWT